MNPDAGFNSKVNFAVGLSVLTAGYSILVLTVKYFLL